MLTLHLVIRGLRNPDYFRRWPERFGHTPFTGIGRVLWIHAVSVGEVRAAAPLIDELRQRYPGNEILVTTMTPTGSQEVRRQYGDGVLHCYVPYDLVRSVRRFLGRVEPCLALTMETELWPRLFHECRQRGIPVMVANARMSEASMRGYLKVARLARYTLGQVDLIAAQSRADARRLIRLGAVPERTRITGSIKFEIKLPASLREAAESLRRQLGSDRPVWIAASTHDGEEDQVLLALRELRRTLPDLLLLLVPRHPERFAPAARLCRRDGFSTQLRSELRGALAPDVEVVVADSMGELLLLYAAADVAFVGGSLVPVGGHNVLEACAVGLPVVFGPHMHNFAEISQMTLARNAARQVAGPGELASAVREYLLDANLRYETGERGKRLVEQNRGALQRTSELVTGLLGGALP